MKDASSGTTPQTSANPTSGTPETQANEGATPSPDAPKPATSVPDTYTFTPPEGQTFDQALLDKATPIFKELGLSQAGAEKLVALWNDQAKGQADLALQTVKAQREKWVSEVKADPSIGPHLETIKADVGRAMDALGDAKLTADFKAAMDLTGAGDNPAFIKAFWKLAQRSVEGKPVSGTGPSPHGQSPSGQAQRPSAARAMYPNNP